MHHQSALLVLHVIARKALTPTKRPRSRRETMPSWLPLESNPDVLNPFIRRLGVPSDWEFTDVFGLDDDDLLAIGASALCGAVPALPFAEHIAGAPRGDAREAARGRVCGHARLLPAAAR